MYLVSNLQAFHHSRIFHSHFCGDFNLVLNIQLDKSGGRPKTHERAQKYLLECMEDYDLIYIWRKKNPDLRRFTWRQKSPLVQCRLDFFLISAGLFSFITRCRILPGMCSDHSLVTLSLKLYSLESGPGYWKFNTSIVTIYLSCCCMLNICIYLKQLQPASI